MDVFKGQNLLEFSDQFKTDENCKEYLASLKSNIKYKCLKYNHTACQNRKDYARQYNLYYFNLIKDIFSVINRS